MLKYLSLSGQPFSDEMEITQYVSVRTGDGPEDFANVLLGDFRTYMTELVNARIDNIDVGGGGSGPSIWPVARTLTLSGPVNGSASFDGSSNFTVLTTIADGGLSIAKTSGLQTALDGKLNTAAYTAADVLAKLLTVDGNGSGLDADMLDGLNSRDYLNNTNIVGGGDLNSLSMQRIAFNTNNVTNAPSTAYHNYLLSSHQGGNYTSTGFAMGHAGVNDVFYGYANGTAAAYGDRVWTWRRMWHAGNFDPASKANVSGQDFTGPVSGTVLYATAANSGLGAFMVLRDHLNVPQGGVMWDRSTDTVRLGRFNAAGDLPEGELSIGPATLTYNGNEIYHAGNLASASGYLSQAAVLHLPGAGIDCNTLTAGSKVVINNSGNTNTPGTSSPYWYIETLMTGTSSDNLLQRAWSISNDEVYYRRAVIGAWGPWRRMWNSGTFDPTSKLDSNAAAASATRLQTARSVSLTGIATGTGTFDGTADLTIATSVADGSLSIAKTNGLQAALDGKLGTGSFGLGSSVSGFDWSNTAAVSRFGGGSLNAPNPGTNVAGFRAALTGSPTTAFTLVGRNDRAWFQSIEAGTVGPWRELWHSGNLTPVDVGRQFLAGNGLTGGGDLANDRTISMGLPGTLNGSTSNAVTSTSHTHALSANLQGWDAVAPSAKANVADVWSTQGALLANLGTQDFSVIDNSIPTGAYQYNTSTSSGGMVQGWGSIIHMRRATGGGETQLMITETGRLGVRGRTTAAWSGWQEFVPYSNVSGPTVNNSVVQRTGAGDIHARMLRSEYDTVTTAAEYVMGQVTIGTNVDNYVRPMSMAALWAKMAPLAVAGTDVASYSRTLSVKSEAIGGSQDLNTYQTTGLWHQANNASATIPLNYPVAFAGLLQVTAANNMVYQSYMAYNSGITYVRSNYNGTWYPWRQLADTAAGVSFAGTVSSSQNFASTSANVVLAGTGGVLYLRPNGVSNATGQLTVSAAGNVALSGTLAVAGGVVVTSGGEAVVELNSTGGRHIRILSNTTPNTGFYDVTNNAWLMRIASDNSAIFGGAISGTHITASQNLQSNLGRVYGSATELNLLGNSASAVVRIRPQGWTVAGQTVFNANGTVDFSNNVNSTGEFVTSTANGLRIASGSVGAILRNDGANFYLLFTAAGDNAGAWNTLRPLQINCSTGNVSMSHGLSVTGVFGATMAYFGTGATAEVARIGNDVGLWDRDIANSIGIRGVQNANLGYVYFGGDGNGLGYNGTNLVYDGTIGLGGSMVVGGSVDFGSVTRQMMNLYSTTYGIGIQGNTMYFRSGTAATTSGGWAWYRGGIHSSAAMDPGAGGVMLGKLDGNGLWSGYDFAIFSDRRVKSKIRPFEFRGRLNPKMYFHDLIGKDDFGFIAQDVQKLYPEAVSKSDETKFLRLSMPKLVAVVSHQVNAVEDHQVKQDKKIEKLSQINKQLTLRLRQIEKQMKKLLARAA